LAVRVSGRADGRLAADARERPAASPPAGAAVATYARAGGEVAGFLAPR